MAVSYTHLDVYKRQDEDLVIPNNNLSVFEDAVACWRGETMSEWKKDFIKKAKDFPIHKPYYQLTKEQKNYLWRGEKNRNFPTIDNFFKMLEENLYKIQYRVTVSYTHLDVYKRQLFQYVLALIPKFSENFFSKPAETIEV